MISVNPFETIPGLYGRKFMDEYRLANEKEHLFSTHLYSIPAVAFENASLHSRNQTIFFSGEVNLLFFIIVKTKILTLIKHFIFL